MQFYVILIATFLDFSFSIYLNCSSIPKFFHAILPTSNKYIDCPLDDDLHKFVHYPQKSKELLRNLRDKIITNGSLTIVVFGGSVVTGTNCEENGYGKQKNCADPKRIEKWLQLIFPKVSIKVLNYAQGGTSSENGITTIPLNMYELEDVDIILTDYSVNDIEMLATPKNAEVASELLILEIYRSNPNAVHIMLLTHCGHCIAAPILNAIRDVAIFHNIAFIDTRLIVHDTSYDRHIDNKRRGTNPFWMNNDGNLEEARHPGYPSHQLIADIVIFALRKGLFPECFSQSFFSDAISRSKIPICFAPNSIYLAEEYYKNLTLNQFIPIGYSWSLIDDGGRNKPGWITLNNHSSITFNVNFGQYPLLIVRFLRSYQGVGNVFISINGNQQLIEGLWDFPYSSAETEYFYNKSDISFIMKNVKAFSQHNITFTSVLPPNTKFKIIDVVSC